VSDLPIVCTLTSGELAGRKDDLLPGLLTRAQEHVALDHGYRFRFSSSSERLAEIVRVIEAERNCCQFLQFHLTIQPGLGPFWLEITGPPGTREFLDDLMTIQSEGRSGLRRSTDGL
jgi:hypothetical protein